MGKGTSEVGGAAGQYDAQRLQHRVALGQAEAVGASSPEELQQRLDGAVAALESFTMPQDREAARTDTLALGQEALDFVDVRLRYRPSDATLFLFDGAALRKATGTTDDEPASRIIEGDLDPNLPESIHVGAARRDSGYAIREALFYGIQTLRENRSLVDPDIPAMPTEPPKIPESYLDEAVDYTAGTAFVAGGGEVLHQDDGSTVYVHGERALLTVHERTPEMLAALRAAAGILAMQLEQTPPQASPEA